MQGLTKTQKKVYIFINEYALREGFPPSVREIGRHLGISSQGAGEHVQKMVKKGYVQRKNGTYRSISLLKKEEVLDV